jgi:hypothetical protein
MHEAERAAPGPMVSTRRRSAAYYQRDRPTSWCISRRALVTLAVAASLVSGVVPSCTAAGPMKPRVASKVSQDLLALHATYSEARRSGAAFHSSNPFLRIEDDRVVIDATAAGDVRALESDLVALGMRHPVAFGRVVSGQLPIAAIPALNKLDSLAFVRGSAAILSPDTGGKPRGP